MIPAIKVFFMLVATSVGCDCKSDGWESVVEKTEALVLHRESFRVPKDPVGSEYEASCVRIRFQIDTSGNPINVSIDKSSRNRVIDVAARETLKKFRFRVPQGDSGEEFALVFEYPLRDAP
ncbi:energy transducer TonB [Luteimonas sp. SJ-92]|uniref:Energy transducer TonB n=1 Tax=Luteimonas salinisoli TaxID=2752307 RepID=A0A853JB06_9GAMM|nr:energy transducer TonB [Luteimonas salinisoli]NZA25924.1 energy transducer TonB [Luteimonas salinisoli]